MVNSIPLGCSLLLPVHTVNCVQTRKANIEFCGAVGGNTDRILIVTASATKVVAGVAVSTADKGYDCLVLKANRGKASQLLRVVSDAVSTAKLQGSSSGRTVLSLS